MASKQGYGADLKNYMDKKLSIKLNGNRRVIGTLRGYDAFMNLVMEDVYEIKVKEKVKDNINVINTKTDKYEDSITKLGSVLIRGNSIIMWECLDYIEKKK